MTPVHRNRPLYRRLFRLPGPRDLGLILALGIGSVSAALLAGFWLAAAGLALISVLATASYIWWNRHRIAVELHMIRCLLRTRPRWPGKTRLPGLGHEAKADFTAQGVARIKAQSYHDAIHALGYVMAIDRGFQLDRLRRQASGRWAEVWGPMSLASDIHQRRLGLQRAAEAACDALAPEEKKLLQAFARGVSAGFQAAQPFGCAFLSYQPVPWSPTDSLVIVLSLFQGLSWSEQPKRAEAILRAVFPPDIAAFWMGEAVDAPPEGLSAWRRDPSAEADIVLDPHGDGISGSNCWTSQAAEGGFLACDLHLPLGQPGPLYQIELTWPGGHVQGLAIAGTPIVVTGSNGALAWGVTNLCPDALDLLPLTDPHLDRLPRTRDRARIATRGLGVTEVDIDRVGPHPVLPEPLLKAEVAALWTGQDPRIGDLRFSRLVFARSVAEAETCLDAAQGVPLNVLLTDAEGDSGHLVAGLIRRKSAAVHAGGEDALAGPERPRRILSAPGILVSANDDAFARTSQPVTYDPDDGGRARRARSLLQQASDLDAMRRMQHDARATRLDPYHEIALAALKGTDSALTPLLAGWDGMASVQSRAFPVLDRFRGILARRILPPLLGACAARDPSFRYGFAHIDRPLLAILRARNPALLPLGAEADGVDAFLRAMLETAARDTRGLTWGQLNRVGLVHPISAQLAAWAGGLLDLPARPEPGAAHTLRVCVPGFGAAGRAILSLGAKPLAEFALPGGQSEHPLSPHYADRHAHWSDPGLPPQGEHAQSRVLFEPAGRG